MADIIKQKSEVVRFSNNVGSIVEAEKIYYSEILNEPAIDDTDIREFVARVEIAYGINLQTNPLEFAKLKDITMRCEELGWSKVDFRIALSNFLDNNEWKTFSRAEFIKYRPERCLHNHFWFEKETDKDINNRALMEGFEVDFKNIKLTYWRYKDDVELPLKKVYPLKNKSLPEAKKTGNNLENFNWNLSDEYMKVIVTNTELENFVSKLQNKK